MKKFSCFIWDYPRLRKNDCRQTNEARNVHDPVRSRFLFYCFKMNTPTMDIDDNKILEYLPRKRPNVSPGLFMASTLVTGTGSAKQSFLELEKFIRFAQQCLIGINGTL